MKNNWDGLQYTNDTLCHSSGPWKEHKYIKKIGEGANAVYKYTKDKVEKAAEEVGRDISDALTPTTRNGTSDKGIKALWDYHVTGEGFKDQIDGYKHCENRKQAEFRARELNRQYRNAQRNKDHAKVRELTPQVEAANQYVRAYDRAVQNAQKDYEERSAAGRISKTVEKGKNFISKLFKH